MSRSRAAALRRYPFPRLLVLVALGLVAGLLLVACGGSDSASASNDGGGEADGATSSRPAGLENFDGTDRTEEFGMTEEELVESIEEVEGFVAACMRDAGFEYVPLDAGGVREAMDSLGTLPGVSDEEYVAQFGYGLSTQPENPGLATVFGEQNLEIVANLSAADQTAYIRSLIGENLRATFVVLLDDENFELAGGCTLAAVEQVFNAEQLSPTYFNPVDALVAADPRFIAAQTEWAGCMREAGFDFDVQEDAEDYVVEQLDMITGGGDPSTLSGPAAEQLRDLQGEERAIAAADFECTEEHVDEIEEQVEIEITGIQPD